MSFLRKWLRPETSSRIGLRPHRDVELRCGVDEAWAALREAVETTLGAAVSIDDPRGGMLEAAFGLVNNERVRCYVEASPTGTRVRLEGVFPAGSAVPERSRAVDALAAALEALKQA